MTTHSKLLPSPISATDLKGLGFSVTEQDAQLIFGSQKPVSFPKPQMVHGVHATAPMWCVCGFGRQIWPFTPIFKNVLFCLPTTHPIASPNSINAILPYLLTDRLYTVAVAVAFPK